MQVWYGSEQVPARLTDPRDAGTVVTVGIFDGVHRGHQAILARVVERARRMARPGGERPMAVAVTFDPHPVLVHRPEAHMPMVASLADRLEALAATGLDAVLVVHYTLDFADQGPSPSGRRGSSTWVRELLQAGEMQGAAEVLGHVHRLRGTVVHGRRRGRELGFPTANLDAASAGVVPPDGVYAGWLVRSPGAAALSGAAGRSPREERLPAAISIGTNPTFDDVPQRTVEAHVLGRADLDLYGEVVAIELVDLLRPMLAFDGLQPLLDQMRADVVETARVLGVGAPRPIRPEDVTAG